MFQFVFENLFKFLQFGSDHEPAIALFLVVVVIVLMIIFGGVEIFKRLNGCNNGLCPGPAFVEQCFVMFCFLFLLIIVVKDHASVLRAYIIPLLVERSGIVCFPEYLQ